MTDTKEQTRKATAASIASRKLTKHRRWAQEMRAAGWTVTEPDQ